METGQKNQENIDLINLEIETDIYTVDGIDYFVDENGDVYELDYEVNEDQSQEPETGMETFTPIVEEQEVDHDLTDTDLKNTPEMGENAIKNKKEGECDLVETETEDLEPFQETYENKPDGSFAMMERLISECQRKSDNKKSRKECKKEVKKTMAAKKMPIIETEDTEDCADKKAEKEEDTEEEEEEKESPKKDTVEICPDELDMLRSKAEKLSELEKEHESFKQDFLKFKDKIEAKEAEEKEVKRQEVIKTISYDFDIAEEELKDDSIEELEKLEKRLGMALKRDTVDSDEDEDEDEEITGDFIHDKYFLEV